MHHRPSFHCVAVANLLHPLQPLPTAVLALIIMGSLPLALIGAVLALWLSGQPLSVASMVGFITLTEIAARNGILKISHTINLTLHEDMPWGRELVMRASLERLTPVLMTALSAGVALIPLMVDAATPGKEILHPVAVTIFGGLVGATALDAFLTPILLLRFGRAAVGRCAPPFKPKMLRRLRSFPPLRLTNPLARRTNMISRILGALLIILLLADGGSASEIHAQHGGQAVDAGEHHVEMVAKAGVVDVYLVGHDNKAVSSAGYKGLAIWWSTARASGSFLNLLEDRGYQARPAASCRLRRRA